MIYLFPQRKAKLFNGQIVKEGDLIKFVDSDGKTQTGKIERRKYNATHSDTGKQLMKRTLFFRNITFEISDYKNAELV